MNKRIGIIKNIGIFLNSVLLIFSCKQKLYDLNYKGEENYKSFYLVDTISIENPVRVYSRKHGGMFILSKEKLNSYRDETDFFMSPDVFILGSDLYRDLALEDFKKYSYPDNGGCEIKESATSVAGLEIYEFVNQPRFVMGLINTNYYHVKHNSYTYFSVPVKDPKAVYHKIVYPICK
jgi:hypothetical protein